MLQLHSDDLQQQEGQVKVGFSSSFSEMCMARYEDLNSPAPDTIKAWSTTCASTTTSSPNANFERVRVTARSCPADYPATIWSTATASFNCNANMRTAAASSLICTEQSESESGTNSRSEPWITMQQAVFHLMGDDRPIDLAQYCSKRRMMINGLSRRVSLAPDYISCSFFFFSILRPFLRSLIQRFASLTYSGQFDSHDYISWL